MDTIENNTSDTEQTNDQEIANSKPAPKRDIWLTILLCVSLAGGAIMCFSYLSMFAMYDLMKEIFSPDAIPEQFQYMQDQFDMFFSTNRFYFLLVALAYAISVTGALFMWKLRKIGFHLYVVAQLACLLLTASFLGVQNVSMGELMLTILFVLSYALRLKLFR